MKAKYVYLSIMHSKFLVPMVFILSFFILFFVIKGFLDNKVIGIIDHPGLQGEIFFQQNVIHKLSLQFYTIAHHRDILCKVFLRFFLVH